jgi:hypothetical protein
MNSKSQGGEPDAKITPSGDEDYYNNYLYERGWTYHGENLGNPLFTSKNTQEKICQPSMSFLLIIVYNRFTWG